MKKVPIYSFLVCCMAVCVLFLLAVAYSYTLLSNAKKEEDSAKIAYSALDRKLDEIMRRRLEQNKIVLNHIADHSNIDIAAYNLHGVLIDKLIKEFTDSQKLGQLGLEEGSNAQLLLELQRNIAQHITNDGLNSPLSKQTQDYIRDKAQQFFEVSVNIKISIGLANQNTTKALSKRYDSLFQFVAFLSIMVMALFIIAFFFFIKSISVPLTYIVSCMKGLKHTDKTHPLIAEIAVLKNTYNSLLENNKKLELELIARAEEAEKLTDKAANANKAKGFFIAIVCHELRNCLNVVSGTIPLLGSKCDQDLINDLNLASNMMMSIVNDVLDYSKISERKLAVVFNRVDMADLCEALINKSKGYMGSSENVRYLFLIKGSVPTSLYTDKYRLLQIINNVVSNSFKFTVNGFVKVRVKTAGAYIQWTIADTGRGMSNESIHTVFQPYEQVVQMDSKIGSGLGMAIVVELVRSLKGTVKIKSSLGRGTVVRLRFINQEPQKYSFTLTETIRIICENRDIYSEVKEQLINSQRLFHPSLNIQEESCGLVLKVYPGQFAGQEYRTLMLVSPNNSGEEKAVWPMNPIVFLRTLVQPRPTLISKRKTEPQPTLSSKAKRKILIAEDIDLNRRLLERGFKQSALHVTFACDGIEAIELAKNTYFDCILMDVNMPHLNGLEATKIIRSLDGYEKVPIYALTGNATNDDINKALDAGMDKVLIKPIKPSELLRLLV
ncbi:response regulator [Agarivorans sp. B2Z047]|uniref:response regulator n=1 Tax=Agarivorans sp. B2Z047 TaxID=2652721 RepID=UPI00128B1A7C|nr:response regulator [Agarivorans sp. B2Z047]MPW30818.1 response regulator [Agarivorans sp. B2Z047]UQN40951.1 response regulator [Agarivorans sp. B2Z047]